MIKLILMVSLMVSLQSLADDRVQYACKHLGKVGVLGFNLKGKILSQEEFYIKLTKINDPLDKVALSAGYLADSEIEAFGNAYDVCINYHANTN
jgi:hypothetical protein